MEITIYFRYDFNFKWFLNYLESQNKKYPFRMKKMLQPYPGSEERDIWNSLVILLGEYSSDLTLEACQDFLGTFLLYWVEIYGYLPDILLHTSQVNRSFSFTRHKTETVEKMVEITRKTGEEVIKEMRKESKVSNTKWSITLGMPKCSEK